jgi:hypothetical protein
MSRYVRRSDTKGADKLALAQDCGNAVGQNEAKVVDSVPGTAQIRGKKHDQTSVEVDHLLGAPEMVRK